jgi:hypothetical protein
MSIRPVSSVIPGSKDEPDLEALPRMLATEGMGGGGGTLRDLSVPALVPRVDFRPRFDVESRTAVGFVLNV